MKIKKWHEFLFYMLFVTLSIFSIFYEKQPDSKLKAKNIIIFTITAWVLILFSPLLFMIGVSAIKILNDMPVLIDYRDYNLLVVIVFIIITILINFIRDWSCCILRESFYLVLLFLALSKLAIN